MKGSTNITLVWARWSDYGERAERCVAAFFKRTVATAFARRAAVAETHCQLLWRDEGADLFDASPYDAEVPEKLLRRLVNPFDPAGSYKEPVAYEGRRLTFDETRARLDPAVRPFTYAVGEAVELFRLNVVHAPWVTKPLMARHRADVKRLKAKPGISTFRATDDDIPF
jgi:hypothetical protein